MADFVAVIRRAVDGLANNTPEMRVRVYEKARSAVQRQLENMKPRPSDEMLRRQLEKLDAAIAAVEAEHAEALPPEPAAPVPPVAAAAAYAAPEPPVEEDAYSGQQPVDDQPAEMAAPDAEVQHALPEERFEPEAHEVAAPEPYVADAGHTYPDETAAEDDDPAATDPVDAPYAAESEPVAEAYSPAPSLPAADPFADDERAAAAVPQDADAWDTPEPTYEPAADQQEEPLVEPARAPVDDSWRPQEPQAAFQQDLHDNREVVYDRPSYHEHVEETADEPVQASPFAAAPVAAPVADVLANFDQPRAAVSQVRNEWPDAPSTAPIVTANAYDNAPAPTAETNDWYLPEATVETDARLADSRPATDEPAYGTSELDWAAPADLGAQSPAAGGPVEPEDIFSAHFDDEQHATAQARMPAVSDLPDLTAPPATSSARSVDDDPLGEFLQPTATASKASPAAGEADDPWNDLEELIGYDRNAAAAGAATGVAGAGARDGRADSAELEALMAAPVAKSYRIKPKPKRSYAVVLLAILGLALLGGGGYAIWMNRSALNSLLGNGAGPEASGSATPAAAPAQTAQTSPAAPASQAAKAGSTPAAANPAAANEPAGPTKFTQRLLANGTEVDAGSGGPQASASGQSVAQLNAPPAEAASGQPASPAAPPATAPAAPATTPSEAPALAGEKIFLYEERVGQSTPIAVEGTVSWALQKEAGENGQPEPVVQGRINIPGRGLTALVTFKRNTDPSLPASHLVEFVFSLPKDFEGGAIDSVSRISMKSTEQDRGDPLIAVPAKITPDFHMVALNDFPDARARNLELLRTRNWMDVPLVYNTGRRALLTMQKGPTGTKAFEEAISGWQAMAPQPGQ